MSERPGIDGSFGRLLEGQLDFIFGLWDEFKKGELPRPILQEKADEYVENIRAALIFTAREAKSSKSAALAHDLLGRFPQVRGHVHFQA